MPLRHRLKPVISGVLLAISYLSPRNDSKWIFIAGDGSRFAENSKYLFLYCAEQREDVTPVWISTSEEVVAELRAEGFSTYAPDSLSGQFHLLTAGVAIETHGPEFSKYLGGATIVDTHHGNALKTMGADEGEGRSGLIENAKHYLWKTLYGSSYFVVTNAGTPFETFRRAMGFDDDELIVAPYPRLDVFYRTNPLFTLGTNTEMLDRVKAEHEERSVVFYAPTFRNAYGRADGTPLSKIAPDFDDLDEVLEETDATLYVSSHPREPMSVDYDRYERIFEMENGDDLYPFLPYCDVLITDYSSIFYDFLLADDPILFHAPDLEEYESSRGLYFDYEEHVPGPISETTAGLCENLENVLVGADDYGDERVERRSEFYVDCREYPSLDAFEAISKRISDPE